MHIDRYDIFIEDDYDGIILTTELDDCGDYVMWDDVEFLLEELQTLRREHERRDRADQNGGLGPK